MRHGWDDYLHQLHCGRSVCGVNANARPDGGEEYDITALLADEKLLAFPEVADMLGVPVTKVHDYVNNGKLVACRVDGVKVVPAALLDENGELSKFVAGAITVLYDGGFNQEEIIHYLFTEDDTLPGRPVDALHGHGAREVIRRAQALAF